MLFSLLFIIAAMLMFCSATAIDCTQDGSSLACTKSSDAPTVSSSAASASSSKLDDGTTSANSSARSPDGSSSGSSPMSKADGSATSSASVSETTHKETLFSLGTSTCSGFSSCIPGTGLVSESVEQLPTQAPGGGGNGTVPAKTTAATEGKPTAGNGGGGSGGGSESSGSGPGPKASVKTTQGDVLKVGGAAGKKDHVSVGIIFCSIVAAVLWML